MTTENYLQTVFDDHALGKTPERVIVDPLSDAVSRLRADGIDTGSTPWTAGKAVLIAEAVNLAAKEIDCGYYELKPGLIDYVSDLEGVEGGWSEDGTFTLYTRESGAVSFHDPENQIQTSGRSWPHEWSGIRRQGGAFRALMDDRYRRLVAYATRPENRERVLRGQKNIAGPMAGFRVMVENEDVSS